MIRNLELNIHGFDQQLHINCRDSIGARCKFDWQCLSVACPVHDQHSAQFSLCGVGLDSNVMELVKCLLPSGNNPVLEDGIQRLF